MARELLSGAHPGPKEGAQAGIAGLASNAPPPPPLKAAWIHKKPREKPSADAKSYPLPCFTRAGSLALRSAANVCFKLNPRE